eukprot:TRINITY_DN20974_c0_g1_i1.p1 TRINITY_DN20974_c0_g1~~TRINITY_DN20974_c0_g1_i1.p1  ORF type:complete len:564 (-),score=119.27 TRINITY_DN20974_c0_g1_i1:200-1891(-)
MAMIFVFFLTWSLGLCADTLRMLSYDAAAEHAVLLQAGVVLQPSQDEVASSRQEPKASDVVVPPLEPPGDTSKVSRTATGTDIGVSIAAFLLFALLARGLQMANTAAAFQKVAPYVAEALGTFALVFTVACCIATGTSTWNALAIAAVLMVMIYATGAVSGGNLNPAVSLALLCAGKADMTLTKMLAYWCSQVVGGICAGFAARALTTPARTSLWSVGPGDGFTVYNAFLVESIYTFMLCFVVLNCATVDSKKGNNYFGLAIGFVIVAGGYAVGGISGAAFNPAVAIGLDLSSLAPTGKSLAWAFAELLGAALAALCFKIVRPSSSDEVPLHAKLLSEFLGTFLLVLTVGLNITTQSAATALSAASALMCMVYALGDVSGGHFNPAVSLAIHLRDEMSTATNLMLFVATQFLAGTCAGAIYAAIHLTGPHKDITHALKPGVGFGVAAAGCAEFFATAVLAYVVLAVATSTATKGNDYFGLAIGWCVVAGGFGLGGVSGGELNPAVSAGIAVANYVSPGVLPVACLTNFVSFSLWELAGGAAAATLFGLTHAAELGERKETSSS